MLAVVVGNGWVFVDMLAALVGTVGVFVDTDRGGLRRAGRWSHEGAFWQAPLTLGQESTTAPVIIEGSVMLPRGQATGRGEAKAWAEAENARGVHWCQCGCGERIRVTARHFRAGIPGYIRGHQFVGCREAQTSRSRSA